METHTLVMRIFKNSGFSGEDSSLRQHAFCSFDPHSLPVDRHTAFQQRVIAFPSRNLSACTSLATLVHQDVAKAEQKGSLAWRQVCDRTPILYVVQSWNCLGIPAQIASEVDLENTRLGKRCDVATMEIDQELLGVRWLKAHRR